MFKFLQDSTLYSYIEDYIGAIPHWMGSLLIMGKWKEGKISR